MTLDAHVIEQTAMVFGQMNEPPGARLRVALTALTMAEWFRDATGADTLLFVDNIFRFSQAGSEVSALLGRMPSAVGYQPTLGTELGELAGANHIDEPNGAITSVQAVYVPADDRDRPCSGNGVRDTSMRSCISNARITRKRACTRPSTRCRRRPESSTRWSSANVTTKIARRVQQHSCSGIANSRTSSRFSVSTS